jgi:hypothetical protein
VLRRLGLAATGGGSLRDVRAHALRLGLATDHLTRPARPTPSASPFEDAPRPELLRTCAANLAAAWFLLRGHEVLWPLEPCRYDFVVRAGDRFHRIQVKTTIRRTAGTSVVSLSNSRRHSHVIYSADEIDLFFVLTDSLDAYLIPLPDVSGYSTIYLSKYEKYRVAVRGQWLEKTAS